MAKRKTIGENPLDALMPNPIVPRTAQSPASTDGHSEGRAANNPRASSPRSQPRAKMTPAPVPTSAGAKPPPPSELLNRIQSLEQQNFYIAWLAGGAILLAVLL
jgi:hypothetical protein